MYGPLGCSSEFSQGKWGNSQEGEKKSRYSSPLPKLFYFYFQKNRIQRVNFHTFHMSRSTNLCNGVVLILFFLFLKKGMGAADANKGSRWLQHASTCAKSSHGTPWSRSLSIISALHVHLTGTSKCRSLRYSRTVWHHQGKT